MLCLLKNGRSPHKQSHEPEWIACCIMRCLQFFPQYMKLLQSGNYVTRRQSLKVSHCLVNSLSMSALLCQLHDLVSCLALHFMLTHVCSSRITGVNRPNTLVMMVAACLQCGPQLLLIAPPAWIVAGVAWCSFLYSLGAAANTLKHMPLLILSRTQCQAHLPFALRADG